MAVFDFSSLHSVFSTVPLWLVLGLLVAIVSCTCAARYCPWECFDEHAYRDASGLVKFVMETILGGSVLSHALCGLAFVGVATFCALFLLRAAQVVQWPYLAVFSPLVIVFVTLCCPMARQAQ